MDHAYVMNFDETRAFFSGIYQNLPIMGPVERWGQRRFVMFDWLKNPADLQLSYITTTIPPKKAFFPPVDPLFSFNLNGHPRIKALKEQKPFVLAGVHPCDLAAIVMLDRAYGKSPAEDRWAMQRQKATIIGVDCQPDEYCFCTSMGTCDARLPSDIFLTPISRGYLFEVISEKGLELVQTAKKQLASTGDIDEIKLWQAKKNQLTKARLACGVADFAELLDRESLTPIWQKTADRCYSCGSCNTTCPTCFCFDIQDEMDLAIDQGVRVRTWDSCQLLEFALVAGDHNFRGSRWQRVRHRWHRKFLYLYNQFGEAYCTGCGRCSRACTVDINIVDVSNQLIEFGLKGAQYG